MSRWRSGRVPTLWSTRRLIMWLLTTLPVVCRCGNGHTVTCLNHPGLPRDVRRAVEGQRIGWQRLHRSSRCRPTPA